MRACIVLLTAFTVHRSLRIKFENGDFFVMLYYQTHKNVKFPKNRWNSRQEFWANRFPGMAHGPGLRALAYKALVWEFCLWGRLVW